MWTVQKPHLEKRSWKHHTREKGGSLLGAPPPLIVSSALKLHSQGVGVHPQGFAPDCVAKASLHSASSRPYSTVHPQVCKSKKRQTIQDRVKMHPCMGKRETTRHGLTKKEPPRTEVRHQGVWPLTGSAAPGPLSQALIPSLRSLVGML